MYHTKDELHLIDLSSLLTMCAIFGEININIMVIQSTELKKNTYQKQVFPLFDQNFL